jgi:hypothetical protein
VWPRPMKLLSEKTKRILASCPPFTVRYSTGNALTSQARTRRVCARKHCLFRRRNDDWVSARCQQTRILVASWGRLLRSSDRFVLPLHACDPNSRWARGRAPLSCARPSWLAPDGAHDASAANDFLRRQKGSGAGGKMTVIASCARKQSYGRILPRVRSMTSR